jgi:hypothetical protein
MKTSEKSNGSLALAEPADNHDISSMPDEFAGLYKAGYASGRELGYRQGYEAGFWDGRRQGDAGSTAAPAAVGNAAEMSLGCANPRLFGLPCSKCRRLMYSDETRCPYCKAPRLKPGEPPSATSCGPEAVNKPKPDGGLEQ